MILHYIQNTEEIDTNLVLILSGHRYQICVPVLAICSFIWQPFIETSFLSMLGTSYTVV